MQALQLPVLEFVTLRLLGGATTPYITMGSIAAAFLIKYTSLGARAIERLNNSE